MYHKKGLAKCIPMQQESAPNSLYSASYDRKSVYFASLHKHQLPEGIARSIYVQIRQITYPWKALWVYFHLALVSSQSDVWFVSYTQNTEPVSESDGDFSFIFDESYLLHLIFFQCDSGSNFTCWESSFICHQFRVNPICGLRDMTNIPDLTQAERKTE